MYDGVDDFHLQIGIFAIVGLGVIRLTVQGIATGEESRVMSAVLTVVRYAVWLKQFSAI